MTQKVDTTTARHYGWGMASDGWHLLDREDLSVIQERVPPGSPHQFRNESSESVTFLVVSAPHAHGDRTDVE